MKEVQHRRHEFANRFTRADIELLADVDESHETLSGPATKKILEREFQHYKHVEYERLAAISVAHIYNLRRRPRYRERRLNYTKTRVVQVAIGERRKPDPQGRPGYIRVDTVNQGTSMASRACITINAVDEVTQWQVVGAVANITQSHLEPVLQAILAQFPFLIRGFHSDNGSEFINRSVSDLLKRLLIEQSRPRKSNDNGLVESKNGTVIRKHMGYGYIAQEQAEEIRVLSARLPSVSEFPSSLWSTRAHHRGKGQREVRVPALRHTLGNLAPAFPSVARRTNVSQTAAQHPEFGAHRQSA